MTRFAWIAFVLAACGDDSIQQPPERMSLCTADLAVAGTIQAPTAPDPTMGCQPAGAWTINIQVADMGTCTNVSSIPTSITVNVTGSQHNEMITHTKVSGEDDQLEINGDNGACNGSFEFVIPNGSQFDQIVIQPHTGTFCPMQGEDGSGNITCGTGAITSQTITINGDGEYDLWSAHP